MKKTKWRQRLRGTCKWSGVTLCVLLFALWLASGWRFVALECTEPTESGGYVRFFGFIGGALMVVHPVDPITSPHDHQWRFICREWMDGRIQTPTPVSWNWRWWSWGGKPFTIKIPLWLPFLLIALPTGYLFWSDHRKRTRLGLCAMCGYDLTGNTSGTCPECGATTPARAAT